MLHHLRPALVLTLLFTLLLGLVYPLGMTGVAALLAPARAGGSLVTRDGKPVGSELIGQAFTTPRYFHGRPSATSAPDPADPDKTIDAPYNAANSSGSNLGPTSQKLVERVKADADAFLQDTNATTLPTDAVTTSGSGLDPHVSPQTALLQVSRVARARGLSESRVRDLVEALVERPFLGILGVPRVNVLLLNIDLDKIGS